MVEGDWNQCIFNHFRTVHVSMSGGRSQLNTAQWLQYCTISEMVISKTEMISESVSRPRFEEYIAHRSTCDGIKGFRTAKDKSGVCSPEQ
jgi:hypothetical protein